MSTRGTLSAQAACPARGGSLPDRTGRGPTCPLTPRLPRIRGTSAQFERSHVRLAGEVGPGGSPGSHRWRKSTRKSRQQARPMTRSAYSATPRNTSRYVMVKRTESATANVTQKPRVTPRLESIR